MVAAPSSQVFRSLSLIPSAPSRELEEINAKVEVDSDDDLDVDSVVSFPDDGIEHTEAVSLKHLLREVSACLDSLHGLQLPHAEKGADLERSRKNGDAMLSGRPDALTQVSDEIHTLITEFVQQQLHRPLNMTGMRSDIELHSNHAPAESWGRMPEDNEHCFLRPPRCPMHLDKDLNFHMLRAKVAESPAVLAFHEQAVQNVSQMVSIPKHHIRGELQSLQDFLVGEAWLVCGNVVTDAKKALEIEKKRSHEMYLQHCKTKTGYIREVTELRNKLRKLPSGMDDALVELWEPLQCLDEEVRDLVLACSEEHIKSFVARTDVAQRVREECKKELDDLKASLAQAQQRCRFSKMEVARLNEVAQTAKEESANNHRDAHNDKIRYLRAEDELRRTRSELERLQQSYRTLRDQVSHAANEVKTAVETKQTETNWLQLLTAIKTDDDPDDYARLQGLEAPGAVADEMLRGVKKSTKSYQPCIVEPSQFGEMLASQDDSVKLASADDRPHGQAVPSESQGLQGQKNCIAAAAAVVAAAASVADVSAREQAAQSIVPACPLMVDVATSTEDLSCARQSSKWSAVMEGDLVRAEMQPVERKKVSQPAESRKGALPRLRAKPPLEPQHLKCTSPEQQLVASDGQIHCPPDCGPETHRQPGFNFRGVAPPALLDQCMSPSATPQNSARSTTFSAVSALRSPVASPAPSLTPTPRRSRPVLGPQWRKVQSTSLTEIDTRKRLLGPADFCPLPICKHFST